MITNLVILFCRVSTYEETNSMSADNLSTCWWPTLTRPDFETADLKDLDPLKSFISYCISNAPSLFGTKAEQNCPSPVSPAPSARSISIKNCPSLISLAPSARSISIPNFPRPVSSPHSSYSISNQIVPQNLSNGQIIIYLLVRLAIFC